jgi:hypothetical protein
MLVTKLAVTVAGGIVLGLLGCWPAAAFSVAVVATALTLSQLRREVEELRAGTE